MNALCSLPGCRLQRVRRPDPATLCLDIAPSRFASCRCPACGWISHSEPLLEQGILHDLVQSVGQVQGDRAGQGGGGGDQREGGKPTGKFRGPDGA